LRLAGRFSVIVHTDAVSSTRTGEVVVEVIAR
jgi:hypothetical protein